ncbi:MAG: hypothetical protein SGILL_003296 [Bacillariaceae sp.]
MSVLRPIARIRVIVTEDDSIMPNVVDTGKKTKKSDDTKGSSGHGDNTTQDGEHSRHSSDELSEASSILLTANYSSYSSRSAYHTTSQDSHSLNSIANKHEEFTHYQLVQGESTLEAVGQVAVTSRSMEPLENRSFNAKAVPSSPKKKKVGHKFKKGMKRSLQAMKYVVTGKFLVHGFMRMKKMGATVTKSIKKPFTARRLQESEEITEPETPETPNAVIDEELAQTLMEEKKEDESSVHRASRYVATGRELLNEAAAVKDTDPKACVFLTQKAHTYAYVARQMAKQVLIERKAAEMEDKQDAKVDQDLSREILKDGDQPNSDAKQTQWEELQLFTLEDLLPSSLLCLTACGNFGAKEEEPLELDEALDILAKLSEDECEARSTFISNSKSMASLDNANLRPSHGDFNRSNLPSVDSAAMETHTAPFSRSAVSVERSRTTVIKDLVSELQDFYEADHTLTANDTTVASPVQGDRSLYAKESIVPGTFDWTKMTGALFNAEEDTDEKLDEERGDAHGNRACEVEEQRYASDVSYASALASVHHAVKISATIAKKGREGVQDFLKQINQKPSPRDVHNHPVAKHKGDSTVHEYKRLWSEMQRFFYLIGDYQSATLCDDDMCPQKPLPFHPNSWCLFLDYKCGKAGDPLLDSNGQQVKDVDDQPIFISGSYESPSSINKVHSSTLFLHEIMYPETCSGHYTLNCEECQKLNQLPVPQPAQPTLSSSPPDNMDSEGEDDEEDLGAIIDDEPIPHATFWKHCPSHANNSNLHCSGNVLNHPTAKQHYNSWYRYKTKVHVVKGCGQLTPAEVRVLRTYLLQKGDPESLMMWIIILFGIKFFLTSDEVLNLTVEDFMDSYYPKGKQHPIPTGGSNALTKCQVVDQRDVKLLAMEIQGKNDTRPHRMAVFADEEHPDLCSVAHLLWYIKTFQIKSGRLFPTAAVLKEAFDSGLPLRANDSLPYNTFRKRLKWLVVNILKRDTTEFKVGTHTLRKTAYLFALWSLYGTSCRPQKPSFLREGQICMGARHKSMQNACTYQKDAATLYEIAQLEGDNVQNRLSPFKPIHLAVGTHGSKVTMSTPYQQSLPALADWWYRVSLGFGRTDYPYDQALNILHVATQRRRREPDVVSLASLIQPHVQDPAMFRLIAQRLDDFVASRVRQGVADILSQTRPVQHPEDPPPGQPSGTATVPQQSSSARRRAEQSPKILDRSKKLPQLTTKAKIEYFLAMERMVKEKADGNLQKLCEADKRYMNRHVVKPLKCFHECCGDSMESFIELYGEKFSQAKFKCKHTT